MTFVNPNLHGNHQSLDTDYAVKQKYRCHSLTITCIPWKLSKSRYLLPYQTEIHETFVNPNLYSKEIVKVLISTTLSNRNIGDTR